jgi:molecular chaperone GrpE
MTTPFDGGRKRHPDVTDIPISDEARAAAGDPVPVPDEDEGPPVDPFYEAARAAEDRYIRLMADFENFRRRAFKERETAEASGVENVVKPLVDVLDNLERALAHSENSPGPLRDGVALTVRQFQDALRAARVLPVEPARGEPFDPVQHEAITTQPAPDLPADHVIQVVSRGYRYGDRVIRPAKVIVSRDREGQAAS